MTELCSCGYRDKCAIWCGNGHETGQCERTKPESHDGKITLHKNKWLSLMEVRKLELGIDGYIYSHETRCEGRIVAILPFRYSNKTGQIDFLLKSEVTPCWSFEPVLSSITGGYEGGNIKYDAVREMLEETGYSITVDQLIPLGESYASKSADTIYTLFAVDLTGMEQGEAIGDGTRIEAEAEAIWVLPKDLVKVMDPQVHVMYMRLCG